MTKEKIKFSISVFFGLFLLSVVAGLAQETKDENVGAIVRNINWAGVKGPYRFDIYCSPKEKVSWSVGGEGDVLFQSAENGVYESREYQLPYEGFEESFYGVWFNTKGNGWIVGGEGVIMHTSDNGYTWQRQISDTEEDLKRVSCIDARHCWILGRNEVFLATNNGGKTWKQLEDISGNDIEFIDSKNGWIVDDNLILLTNDGGKSWVKSTIEVAVEKNEPSYNATHFSSIKFINKKVGWVAGNSKIARTMDGGKTWNVTKIDDEDYPNFVGIVSKSESTALAVNKGKYNYCTEDAGKTWNKCFRRQDINNVSSG